MRENEYLLLRREEEGVKELTLLELLYLERSFNNIEEYSSYICEFYSCELTEALAKAQKAVELSRCEFMVGNEGNGKAKQENYYDALDANALKMLDLISSRYHVDPLAIAEKYTLRQVLALFALCYNAKLDEAKSKGAEVKETSYLNAEGLTLMFKALPLKYQMKHFAELKRRNNK